MRTFNPAATNTAAPAVSKVPEITAWFWVLKLLTTALGEAASDYLMGTFGAIAAVVAGAAFAASLWVQFRTRSYRPSAYWTAVIMIAVFGTMAADLLHHGLHVPLMVSTLLYGFAVAATFWAWHHAEGTLSIHSITTRRREMSYWLAVSFTFALGTAAGDLTADQFKLGFDGSIALFFVLIAVPAVAHRQFRLNAVVAFWWAYIVTRPLGASIADWLSKPTHRGGLGYGDGAVTAVLLAITLALLTYLAVNGPRRPGQPDVRSQTQATLSQR